jgi:hypothetical protein
METKTQQTVVTVTFNGDDQTINYEPHQQVQAVLDHAMNEFGVHNNRHLMSLFTTDGVELDDHQSMEAAGVRPGDLLVLRQSTVKGG